MRRDFPPRRSPPHRHGGRPQLLQEDRLVQERQALPRGERESLGADHPGDACVREAAEPSGGRGDVQCEWGGAEGPRGLLRRARGQFCEAATATVELCGWCCRGLAHSRRPERCAGGAGVAGRRKQSGRPRRSRSSGVVQAVNGRWLKTYTVRYDDGKTWTGELRKLFYELVVVGGADAGVREASAQRKLDCENLADTIALAVQLSERHPLALTELRLARVHVKGFEGLLARAVNLGLGDREQCSLLMSRTAGYAATLKAAHETLMRSKRFGVLPATAAAEDTLADGAVRDAVRAAQPGATWDLLSSHAHLAVMAAIDHVGAWNGDDAVVDARHLLRRDLAHAPIFSVAKYATACRRSAPHLATRRQRAAVGTRLLATRFESRR